MYEALIPSCNRVSACLFLNTIFNIEINKNAWEKFFSFIGSNSEPLGKSFPFSSDGGFQI